MNSHLPAVHALNCLLANTGFGPFTKSQADALCDVIGDAIREATEPLHQRIAALEQRAEGQRNA